MTTPVGKGWLSGATAAGTQQFPDQQNNEGYKGVAVDIDVTNANGGTLTVTIEAVDPISGVHSALLVSTGIVANGHTRLHLYPGIAVAANLAASMILGRKWSIKAVVATATMTFTIGAELLP